MQYVHFSILSSCICSIFILHHKRSYLLLYIYGTLPAHLIFVLISNCCCCMLDILLWCSIYSCWTLHLLLWFPSLSWLCTNSKLSPSPPQVRLLQWVLHSSCWPCSQVLPNSSCTRSSTPGWWVAGMVGREQTPCRQPSSSWHHRPGRICQNQVLTTNWLIRYATHYVYQVQFDPK